MNGWMNEWKQQQKKSITKGKLKQNKTNGTLPSLRFHG